MSLISLKNDYDYFTNPDDKIGVFQGYGDETMNEIHEKLYYMARLITTYNDLLFFVKNSYFWFGCI